MNLSFRDVVFKRHFMDTTGFVEVVTQSCCSGWQERWGRSRKAEWVPAGLFFLLPSTHFRSPFSWAARFISLMYWGFVYNIMEGND